MKYSNRAALLLLCILAISARLGAREQAQHGRRATAAESPPNAIKGAVRFEDIAREAGLNFSITCGTAEKRYIMESLCGGIALFDYDNDGWIDIFLVNGATLDHLHDGPASKLFRNNHDGTFTDATERAGLTHRGWGFGVAVGDYDNDGWEDLYVTYIDGGVLYKNTGGKFVDVTTTAGVDNRGSWGTSAAFGDFDHDGYLDLYVANYVDIDVNKLPPFGAGVYCQYRSIPVSCGPRGMRGGRDHLYRNNRNGTFSDVSEKLKIDPDGNYGLGVLWGDFDRDGCLDLYVADDSTPSMFYKGDCRGGLLETGLQSGLAYSSDGHVQAGMGIDAGDFDHSGSVSIAKTNFSDDTNNLYRYEGNEQFTDVEGPSHFGPISYPFLGFGVKFFDYDNDGWPDIFVANGHVNPQLDKYPLGITYAERNFLFHNLTNGKYEEVGAISGPAFSIANVGRGAAIADLWNNGNLEIVVTRLDGNVELLKNIAPGMGHWIAVKCIGTKSNRDGFGARVSVTVGEMVQTDEVRANSSYLSASDPRLHFGLGLSKKVDSIEVRWPSGLVDKISNQAVDRLVVIKEGGGLIR